MKLLKAPEPGSPELILMRVEIPKWHWRFYGAQGLVREDIGPLEVREMLFIIRREPKVPTN